MSISLKIRQQVLHICGGYCAYCGITVDMRTMQVDHAEPKCSWQWHRKGDSTDPNDITNLMPSCRWCNHYKRSHSIAGFRKVLLNLHNHKYLSRNCYAPAEVKKKSYILTIAILFGITPQQPWNGIFYFENQHP